MDQESFSVHTQIDNYRGTVFKGRKIKSSSFSGYETKFENSERTINRKLRKFHHDTVNMDCKNLNSCEYRWCISNTVDDGIY